MKLAVLVVLVAACGDGNSVSTLDTQASRVVVDPPYGVVADGQDAARITITLLGHDGAPLAGRAPTIISGALSIGTLSPTDTRGITTTAATSTVAEIKTITVSVDDAELADHPTIEFVAGPPAKLSFLEQPTDTETGSPLAAVRVAFVDAFDNVVANETGLVTVALGPNPSPATLSGTTSANAIGGITTFDQLVVSAPAAQLVLQAASLALSPVTSTPFDVVVGVPSTLSTLTVLPSTALADGVAGLSVLVTLRNAGGIEIPNYSVMVSATGTGNFFYPGASGITDAQGRFTATLSSTVMGNKTVTATAGALVLTAPASFLQPPCTPMLPGLPSLLMPQTMTSLRAGRFDGDAHVDLAFVEPTNLVIMRGLGNGTLHPPERYATGTNTTAVASADLDNDGDVDFVIARLQAGELKPFSNAGNGLLSAGTPISLTNPMALETADLNSDGTADLVVRAQHTIHVFLGFGNGAFQAATAYPLAVPMFSIANAWLALGDLNNDGHVDVVTSDSNSYYVVLLGSANGSLQALTPVYTGDSLPVALGDLDGDGQLDVALGFQWHHGNGNGTFTAQTNLHPFGRAQFVSIVDFDADGKRDLVAASTGTTPYTVDVILGGGNGTFQPNRVVATNFIPSSAAIADLNEDGQLDIAVTQFFTPTNSLTVILGTTGGALLGAWVRGGTGSSAGYFADRTGDFNGDGMLDFVAVDPVTHNLGVQLSAADGTLTEMPAVVGIDQQSVDVGDFDGDGKLDIVAPRGSALDWLRGNGDGTLQSAVTTSTPRIIIGALKSGDLDSNGTLDLVITNGVDAMITVVLGAGDGTFTNVAGYTVGSRPIDLAVGDLDNDSDLDVVVANADSPTVSVLRNQGNGTFGAATSLSLSGRPWSVAVGDLDADGNLDVVASNGSVQNTILVFRGHGDGSFDPATAIQVGVPTYWIEVMDIDGNGTQDVVANFRGILVLRGTGNGTFLPPLFYEAGTGGLGVLADLNADSRRDMMFAQLRDERGFTTLINRGCL